MRSTYIGVIAAEILIVLALLAAILWMLFAPSSASAEIAVTPPAPLLLTISPELVLPTGTPVFVLPTNTPSFTLTPAPTPTNALVNSGDLTIIGPLTYDQQVALYAESQKYIAPTYPESKQVYKNIRTLPKMEASVICGPLSASILLDANILYHTVTPYEFFLLNPYVDKDRDFLEKTFPEENFTHTRFNIRIDRIDWATNPLYPGDFVYIYRGNSGNFEHMLVVTRVDSSGRAYSVTNYNTPEGFVVNEALLYDPQNPGIGLFYQWTKEHKALLGSTGFSGLEVWRSKGE